MQSLSTWSGGWKMGKGACVARWRHPGNAGQGGRQRHFLTLLFGTFKAYALWRTNWHYLSKVQMHIPFDPGMTHLVIYPSDKLWSHIGTRLPITALLVKAKDWKKPSVPWTGIGWINYDTSLEWNTMGSCKRKRERERERINSLYIDRE